MSLKNMARIAMFSALICVSAFIRIPVGFTHITMQVAMVTLSVFLLGWKPGALSVIIYIAIGLAGAPVFTNGGGITYVFQPSFGYLIGFLLSCPAMGLFLKIIKGDMTQKKRFAVYLTASLIGMAVIYICGAVYYYFLAHLYLGKPIAVWPLILNFIIIFIPGDLLFNILAAAIAVRLKKILH